jgi:hypothetical protein
MKRTDMERMQRELRRVQKREAIDGKRADVRDEKLSVATCAKRLCDALMFDEHAIYNAQDDEDVLDVLLEIKEGLPDKQHVPVLKKAVKLTKVKDMDHGFDELKNMLDAC